MIELCEWRRADDDLEDPLLVRVAGTQFHDGTESARPDDAVRLEREPRNAHDADAALTVLADSGETFGRVPRPYTTLAARLLDARVPLVGTITRRLGVPGSYGRWVVEVRRRDRSASSA